MVDSLSGIAIDDIQDFPRPVKDSLTVLPFVTGGESQLAVTDVPDDLVLVSALRRFENRVRIAEGTHTGGNNVALLTDSTADFINWGVQVGDKVRNTTDGSEATITAVTATTLAGALSGGTQDDWDTGEAYQVDKILCHQSARAQEIRKIRITTDLDIYVEIDGEASSASHLVRVNAGAALNEDGIRAVSRISFINVTTSEQPTVLWYVWGI